MWHVKGIKQKEEMIKYETIMSLQLQISSIIINIHFLYSPFLRCSIKTHKYFPMSRETFSVRRKNHLFSHDRSKTLLYWEKSGKVEENLSWRNVNDCLRCRRRRVKALKGVGSMNCESWKYYESDVVFLALHLIRLLYHDSFQVS